jgi:hypothetical protein
VRIAADLVLARNNVRILLTLGIVLGCIHMGMTQGLPSTRVVASAPVDQRGTAFGIGFERAVNSYKSAEISGAIQQLPAKSE